MRATRRYPEYLIFCPTYVVDWLCPASQLTTKLLKYLHHSAVIAISYKHGFTIDLHVLWFSMLKYTDSEVKNISHSLFEIISLSLTREK